MWWFVAIFVVSLVVAYSMRPKNQSVKPSGLEDITVPTAEDGREIPVLFGTRIIEGANLVWYGDLKTEPIRK